MRLIILGAGGFGRTVADMALQSGRYDTVVHLDDNPGRNVIGKLASYQEWKDGATEMVPAFGNNSFRLNWCQKIAEACIPLATIVHAKAYVSPTATIGAGTVVLPMAVVNTETVVEMGCIINCGALIDHGCVIEEGCHICLGAVVKAENRIAALTKIDAGGVIEARTYPRW